MQFRSEAFHVEDDFRHILFHTGNGGKLMKNPVDLDGGNSDAGKGGKQNSSQAVSQGCTKTALQRFHRKLAVGSVGR